MGLDAGVAAGRALVKAAGRPRRLKVFAGLALMAVSGFYLMPRGPRVIEDFPESAISVGWRGDGTGRYPQADPPVEWGPEANVLWTTPMPAHGNASPVISGDRLFVCGEPTTLICVRAADGRILWQRTNGYDVLADGWWRARRIRRAVRRVTEKTRELNLAQYERHEVRKKRRVDRADESLRRQAGQLSRRIVELQKELKALDRYGFPGAHCFTGYSSPTPVTNGKYVYALFGTALVVCYDMEGALQWARRLENPPHHWGVSASPLLVGKTLVVHVNQLRGLDATSGRDLWKVKVPWGWGTSVHARIGQTDYVFTPGGSVVRVSDGKVLPVELGKLEYCAPVFDGDVLYYIQRTSRAYRLAESFPHSPGVRELWRGRIKKDRYYASPLVHDGLIYAVTRGRYLSVLDRQSGETLYERALDLGAADAYSRITMAGGYIYVSSEEGITLVLKPGARYREVATNELEPFRCCPVFSGGRMYVRGLEKLYCIGE